MNTRQVEYKTDIAHLAANNTRRDVLLMIWIVVVVGLGFTILGFIQG